MCNVDLQKSVYNRFNERAWHVPYQERYLSNYQQMKQHERVKIDELTWVRYEGGKGFYIHFRVA